MSRILPRWLGATPETGRIDAIEPHPRNPNYLRVIVDGRAIVQIPANDVEPLELQAGRRWTTRAREAVERLLALARIRRAALLILGRRAVSIADLRDRLIAKGDDPDLVHDVARTLADEGWIDEHALADSVVHAARRGKPAARPLLEEKLRRHGIEEHIIATTLDAHDEAHDPFAEALALAMKRHATMRHLDSTTTARRLAGVLARRGFDESIIERVLDRLRLHPDATDIAP